MNRREAWWWVVAVITIATAITWGLAEGAQMLPPGAPDVTQPEWRPVGSKFIPIRQQGTDTPYLLFVERYLDSTSQNEVELRWDLNVESRPVVVVAWGLAASERWDYFYVEQGYITCVNKQHVLPATPVVTGRWYDLFGPEGDACRLLSDA